MREGTSTYRCVQSIILLNKKTKGTHMQCFVDNRQVNQNNKKFKPINANPNKNAGPKIQPKNRDKVPRPNHSLPNTKQGGMLKIIIKKTKD